MQNQNPSNHEHDEKKKQSLFNWVKNHKVTIALIAIFYFSLNVFMNYFSNNPRLFYFPAIAACVAFCWIVLSGTHKFVASQLLPPQPTSAPASKPVETIKNVATNLPSTMIDSITRRSPSDIVKEINSVRPIQKDAVAKSFSGAKVTWVLNLFAISDRGIGFEKTVAFTANDANILVFCRGISSDDQNLLILEDKGAQFYVSGTIQECKSNDITLSNCKLKPYTTGNATP
jgi:hypothetical protein